AHAEVMQRLKRLTDTLAAEIKRRETAEKHIKEITKERETLGTRLGGMEQKLEGMRKQLQAQLESSGAEQSRLEARTQELQTEHDETLQRVKRLTGALTE